jgi:prepilin-type N-terminal cleavage/methylation domain-containing protein
MPQDVPRYPMIVKTMSHFVRHRRRGFTLVELLAVLAIIGLLLGLLVPAVQRAREAGRLTQCNNNLKNMGLALSNYQSAKRLFPPGNEQLTGRFHAWSSFILPFLEESGISGRIDYTKPWDDIGGNARLADMNIPTYICPSGIKMFAGKQDYGGVLGAWIDLDGNTPTTGDYEHSGILYATDRKVQRPASPAAVSDGLSRTLMVTEASDREHVGNDETRRAGDSCWACGSNCFPLNARVINVAEVDGFQSKHFDGVYGLFGDGHVTFITNRTDAKVLIAISTKSGGETESLAP